MVTISKYLSSSIEKGRRIIKILTMGLRGTRQSYESSPFGVDGHPIKGVRAIYAESAISGQSLIIGYINTNQIADVGELRLYSVDANGKEKANCFLRSNGDIELNGKDDNLTRYSELKKSFDELRDDFNSLVNSYNSHIHTTTATVSSTAVPGVIAPTPTQGTPSTVDISKSKVDNLKCS